MAKLDELQEQIIRLYDGTGSAAYQNLLSLSTWAGTDEFPPGKELRDAIWNSGRGIEERLRGFDKMLRQIYVGLTNFLANSKKVEDLNSLSAQEFLNYLNVGGGGGSPTPPPGGGSGAGPR
ncbi:hypothetical protein A6A27_40105 [Micromonospora sp. CB01531]|nr:hypothetical protein A6A27_40105 [Micromonospora sp. CB01531]